MSLSVRITPEAEAQIREIDEWWRQHRPASPDLFLNELAESFQLVSEAPQIGRLYPRSPVRDVRRLLLRKTRYHIYYLAIADEVRILAIWHAQRGVGPPVRISAR